MQFLSASFLVFLPICLAAYWLLPTRKLQNLVLVVASIVFYGWFDWRFVGLLALTVVVAYFAAFGIERYGKRALVPGVTFCTGILIWFKYYDFFADSVASVCSAFGLSIGKVELQIVLPVGVSFFTFQAIGYLVDVYRGKLKAERSFLDFTVFMCFFPQLVAGPIGRGPELLPQYKKKRVFNEPLATEACRQLLWGAFAKFVAADNCSVIASSLLGCQMANSGMIACGALAYTVQIYCDFSGYSNMAIGLGKLFGIRLRQNFACPYFATSFTDFWRRWHMSLTTWFRDYVYFPMGGSRCSTAKTVRNIWIVFLLSGLWHGAAWTFVAWGGVHAFFLTVDKKLKGRWLLTMIGVSLAWLVFQAPDFAEAGRYFRTLFTQFGAAVWPTLLSDTLLSAILGAGVVFGVEWRSRKAEFGLSALSKWRTVRWLVYLSLAFAVICCSGRGEAFIYAKF